MTVPGGSSRQYLEGSQVDRFVGPQIEVFFSPVICRFELICRFERFPPKPPAKLEVVTWRT